MSIERDLRDLILSRYGSIPAFSAKIGMSASTLYSILSKGIDTATTSNMSKICRDLHISMDALIMDEEIKTMYRTSSDRGDIADALNQINADLTQGDVYIDGQKADDQAISLIMSSTRIGLQMAREHMEKNRIRRNNHGVIRRTERDQRGERGSADL